MKKQKKQLIALCILLLICIVAWVGLTKWNKSQEQKKQEEEAKLNREKQLQQAMLGIQKKYGKNAVLKGMNLEEGATARERNRQIGGHKA